MQPLITFECVPLPSSTHCDVLFATSTASSTLINSFTAGEIVECTLLAVILVGISFNAFYTWLRGVKIRQ